MAYVSLLEGLPKMSCLQIQLSGGEMPEWFVPCEDGSTSFMVPKDLYDKYLGLAYCAVFRQDDNGEIRTDWGIQMSVNGETVICSHMYDRGSSGLWIRYIPRCQLPFVDKHPRCDWNDFQVRFRQKTWSQEIVKLKFGFCLIFEKEEDARRIVVQRHPPTETDSDDEGNSICQSETDAEESRSTLTNKRRLSSTLWGLSYGCRYFYFSSRCELFRKKMAYASLLEGFPKASRRLLDPRGLQIYLSGGEMPDWFLPCEDGCASFVVPKDLYDKFVGVALCAVVASEEVNQIYSDSHVDMFINGQSVVYSRLWYFRSPGLWIRHVRLPGRRLRGESSNVQVRFRQKTGSLIKCGVCLIFEKQEGGRRVVGLCSNTICQLKQIWIDEGPTQYSGSETDAEESRLTLTKKRKLS